MNEVFVCDVLHHDTAGRPLEFERPVETQRPTFDIRNWRGEPLPREAFPTRIFGWSEDPENEYEKYGGLENLPHMLRTFGVALSEQAAHIFRQFDLGKASLYPVELYRNDRKTLFDLRYEINFGNVKSGYLPAISPATVPRSALIGGYYVPYPSRNDDIVLAQNVLSGPDLWVDPLVADAFFVSGALAKALNEAGMQSDFNFMRCRIVEGKLA